LAAVLVLLAGSDLPPPVGFIWVVAGAVAVGALVRALVPPVLGLRHTRGMLRTLLAAGGIGAGVGVGCAALLVFLGSGEPTVDSPSAGQAATFVVVVAVVGAVSAAAISATAIFSAAMSRRQLAVLVAAAPGAAVSLLALSVIGTRLVT
jgi:hypothetical protein